MSALGRKAYWEQFDPTPELVVMFPDSGIAAQSDTRSSTGAAGAGPPGRTVDHRHRAARYRRARAGETRHRPAKGAEIMSGDEARP